MKMRTKQPDEFEPLLTIRDVAAIEKTCERTVRRRIAAGELRAIRMGRLIRIRPRDLRAYHLARLQD